MLRGDGNRASHPFTTHKDTHASVGIVLQLSTGIKKTEISRAVTVSYAFGLLAATAKSDRLLNDRTRFESAAQTQRDNQ